MGDMAEMMRDGTLCADCGSVFSDMLPTRDEEKRARRENRLPVSNAAPPGHSRYCKECSRDRKRSLVVADRLTARQRFDAAEDLRREAEALGRFNGGLFSYFAYAQFQDALGPALDSESDRRFLMLLLAEAIEQGDLP